MNNTNIDFFEYTKNILREYFICHIAFLLTMNQLFFTIIFLKISAVYLVLNFTMYKLIKFKNMKKILKYNFLILNIGITIIYLIYFLIYTMHEENYLLFLVLVSIYIINIIFAKKRIKDVMRIETDEKGIIYGKVLFASESPKISFGSIILIGSIASLIKETPNMDLLVTLYAFIGLILVVFRRYLEIKYFYLNNARYIYRESKK